MSTAVRPSKRERAARFLDQPGLLALLRQGAAWRGPLVLNYHRVGRGDDTPWDHVLWSADAELFDEQLAFLARHFDVIGPGDVDRALTRRRGRHVLLTFDDGYRDNHDIAFPVLRRHGLTATFFLVAGWIDDPLVAWWDELAWMVHHATRPALAAGPWLPADLPLDEHARKAAIGALTGRYKGLRGDEAEPFLDHVAEATGAGRCPRALAADTWMTWDMARAMRAAGMTIGGHTTTHPVLSSLPAAEQEAEVAVSARRHREELGEAMRWFAYPVGTREAFDDDTKAALRAHGVELAFSFYGGWSHPARWDPLDVRRTYVGPELRSHLLRATLSLPQIFVR